MRLVCLGVRVRVRVGEIKSFNITDVRKWGYRGSLDGLLEDASPRLLRSMQALTELFHTFSSYASSNSLRELFCLVG